MTLYLWQIIKRRREIVWGKLKNRIITFLIKHQTIINISGEEVLAAGAERRPVDVRAEATVAEVVDTRLIRTTLGGDATWKGRGYRGGWGGGLTVGIVGLALLLGDTCQICSRRLDVSRVTDTRRNTRQSESKRMYFNREGVAHWHRSPV